MLLENQNKKAYVEQEFAVTTWKTPIQKKYFFQEQPDSACCCWTQSWLLGVEVSKMFKLD